MTIETLIALLQIMAAANPGCAVTTWQYEIDEEYQVDGITISKDAGSFAVVIR